MKFYLTLNTLYTRKEKFKAASHKEIECKLSDQTLKILIPVINIHYYTFLLRWIWLYLTKVNVI